MWGPRIINFGDNNVALTDWFPCNQHVWQTSPRAFQFRFLFFAFFICLKYKINDPALLFKPKNVFRKKQHKPFLSPLLSFILDLIGNEQMIIHQH